MTTTEKINWKSLELVDSDGNYADEAAMRELLREWRDTECIADWFFPAPLEGQDGKDASEWGPELSDVDWTGFEFVVSDGNARETYASEDDAETAIREWWTDAGAVSDAAAVWLDSDEADRRDGESLQDYADRICQRVAEANGGKDFYGHGNYHVSAAAEAGMSLTVTED